MTELSRRARQRGSKPDRWREPDDSHDELEIMAKENAC